MTFNDLISHRKNLRDVYKQLPILTIAEAGKEPLKLSHLSAYPKRVPLFNNNPVDYAVAICVACVSHLDMRYPRKNFLTEDEKQFIGERMTAQYQHWTVLDLPCFESMLIGGRIPTVRNGQTEYELSGINIPTILSKAEVYNRMRPSYDGVAGMSPMKTDERPLAESRYHTLMDGTPYEWHSRAEAEHYWRSPPDKANAQDMDFVKRVGTKKNNINIHTVNDALAT